MQVSWDTDFSSQIKEKEVWDPLARNIKKHRRRYTTPVQQPQPVQQPVEQTLKQPVEQFIKFNDNLNLSKSKNIAVLVYYSIGHLSTYIYHLLQFLAPTGAPEMQIFVRSSVRVKLV